MIKPKSKTVWNGTHDGVAYEIQNFQRKGMEAEEDDCWTFYLYINLGKIPEEYKPKSFWLKPKQTGFGSSIYMYNNHKIISQIEFHSGCSWYSKEGGDAKTKVIKIGCDYMHLWDVGNTYFIEEVLRDVQTAIESFRRLVPGYKYWCRGNGGFYDVSEGELTNGSFMSFDWIKEQKKRKNKT